MSSCEIQIKTFSESLFPSTNMLSFLVFKGDNNFFVKNWLTSQKKKNTVNSNKVA